MRDRKLKLSTMALVLALRLPLPAIPVPDIALPAAAQHLVGQLILGRQGHVVRVAGDGLVYIDLGTEQGVTVGQQFAITRRGEPITDAEGRILGQDETNVGTIVISKVRPKYAVGKAQRAAPDTHVQTGDLVAESRPGLPKTAIVMPFAARGATVEEVTALQGLVETLLTQTGMKLVDPSSFRIDVRGGKRSAADVASAVGAEAAVLGTVVRVEGPGKPVAGRAPAVAPAAARRARAEADGPPSLDAAVGAEVEEEEEEDAEETRADGDETQEAAPAGALSATVVATLKLLAAESGTVLSMSSVTIEYREPVAEVAEPEGPPPIQIPGVVDVRQSDQLGPALQDAATQAVWLRLPVEDLTTPQVTALAKWAESGHKVVVEDQVAALFGFRVAELPAGGMAVIATRDPHPLIAEVTQVATEPPGWVAVGHPQAKPLLLTADGKASVLAVLPVGQGAIVFRSAAIVEDKFDGGVVQRNLAAWLLQPVTAAEATPPEEQKPQQPKGVPWIGIKVRNVSPGELHFFKLPSANGAFITEIERNSPARKAKLNKGDIIIAINDQALTDAAQVNAAVKRSKPGDVLTFTVWRRRQPYKIQVPVIDFQSTIRTLGGH